MIVSTPDRKNNLNLLRLVFAILVLLSHAPELVDGNRKRELLTGIFQTVSFGELAVDGFFLLSGYLIVQSWCKVPDVWRFLKSRVLRIFPGFLVATMMCAFVIGPIASVSSDYFATLPLADLASGALQLQPPTVPAVFEGTHYPFVNGAMWTISLEFVCYLAVLVAGVLGITKNRLAWAALTAGFLTLFAIQRFGLFDEVSAKYFLSHPLLRLGCFFLAGGTFYLYRDKLVFDRKIAFVAGGALLEGMFSRRISELAMATAGGYLLFYFAFAPVASIANFNKLPDISYGTYLYGWPVQKLLLWYFPSMSPWLLFLFSCAVALTLGVLSWYAIEKPCLRFKREASKKAVATQLSL